MKRIRMYLSRNLETERAVINVNKTFVRKIYFVPLKNTVPFRQMCQRANTLYHIEGEDFSSEERGKKEETEYRDTYITKCSCVLLLRDVI